MAEVALDVKDSSPISSEFPNGPQLRPAMAKVPVCWLDQGQRDMQEVGACGAVSAGLAIALVSEKGRDRVWAATMVAFD